MDESLSSDQAPLRPEFPQKTLHRDTEDLPDLEALLPPVQEDGGGLWVFRQKRAEGAQVLGVHPPGVFHLSHDLHQNPAFDPAEPEPIPQDDFDQSWSA